MADGLVTFCRSRLDEDERDAEAASPGPWNASAEGDEVLAVDGIAVADGFALSGRQLRATVAHIARHDPTRVLADVEAKRRIVDDYEQVAWVMIPWAVERANALQKVLKSLAAVYAAHPEFREAWRP